MKATLGGLLLGLTLTASSLDAQLVRPPSMNDHSVELLFGCGERVAPMRLALRQDCVAGRTGRVVLLSGIGGAVSGFLIAALAGAWGGSVEVWKPIALTAAMGGVGAGSGALYCHIVRSSVEGSDGSGGGAF